MPDPIDDYTRLSYQEIAHMTLRQFHSKVMDSHSKGMLVGGQTWTSTEFYTRTEVYAIRVLAEARQWHIKSARPE